MARGRVSSNDAMKSEIKLIKQHYVADVLGGLTLAFGVSWFFLNRIAPKAKETR